MGSCMLYSSSPLPPSSLATAWPSCPSPGLPVPLSSSVWPSPPALTFDPCCFLYFVPSPTLPLLVLKKKCHLLGEPFTGPSTGPVVCHPLWLISFLVITKHMSSELMTQELTVTKCSTVIHSAKCFTYRVCCYSYEGLPSAAKSTGAQRGCWCEVTQIVKS